ncbi:MAG: hydantoinase/oxoprolinase family protein [Euzebyaceae bacterium]|jgi:N-methylhydantoinase A|nr:hydantoinase/oxoprolinase family protein [Euzebyaceae bacterium]
MPTSRRSAAGIDVGGTFTDVVVTGGGRLRAVKVPTTPDDQGEGLAQGLRAASDADVPTVAHGTTTATNAVLERNVATTVLVTTDGFRDVLTIARQDRPSLYDLAVVRPAPLVDREHVVTVVERTAGDGSAVVALSDDEVDRLVAAVAALQPESVAVSLLFAYAGPEHEQRLCAALAKRLDVPITRSSALLPELREYERASTCVLNAAVAPVMRRYLSGLRDRLPGTEVTVMTSGGGVADLATVAEFPVHTLLSGPAAGVVAAAAVAAAAGHRDAVAFDMGGTSTDTCLVRHGRPEIAVEATIAGLPFRTPAVAVHSVGAGGGSLAWVDAGGALRVGPGSAGARPGPACYGFGGTKPTVTDAHAALGHLGDGRALGSGAAVTLDRAAAVASLETLEGFDDPLTAAEGVLTVVRATMARALRKVSTERGVDPAGLVLVAYGGAGPLHAAALASELGCTAALVPPAPGVLSALGLLLAPPRHEASRTVMACWTRDGRPPDLDGVYDELAQEAKTHVQGRARRLVDCRYLGQSHELRLDLNPGADIAALLDEAHREAYGYSMPDETVEVVTLRVVVEGDPVLPEAPRDWDQGEAQPERRRRIGVGGEQVDARVVDRAGLSAGERLTGPALVEQPDSTTLLGPDDVAEVDAAGNLVLHGGAH